MKNKRFNSLQGFMVKHNINIILDGTHISPMQGEYDFNIMDQLIKHLKNYSTSTYKTKVSQIHYCCKYLQVTTMYNLTNATGRHIDLEKFHGKTFMHSSFTTLNKFNQTL